MIERLYSMSPMVMGVGLFVLLMLGTEVGLRVGRRREREIDDRVRSVHLTAQGALLGLLALLLGFSFAMAAARYETRRQQVLTESNAIGSAFLRSELLPKEHAEPVRGLLRKYVASRLEIYHAGNDHARTARAITESESIQRELWTHAVAISGNDSRGSINALFVEAVNDMIDVHATRIAALRDHVPNVILAMLVGYSVFSAASLGYVFGLVGKRQTLVKTVFTALIVLVIMVIVDLDSPRSGMIRVSQRAMEDLQQQIGTK